MQWLQEARAEIPVYGEWNRGAIDEGEKEIFAEVGK